MERFLSSSKILELKPFLKLSSIYLSPRNDRGLDGARVLNHDQPSVCARMDGDFDFVCGLFVLLEL